MVAHLFLIKKSCIISFPFLGVMVMLEGVITGGYLFFTMSINLKKNNTLINNTSNHKKKGINGVSKEKHLF